MRTLVLFSFLAVLELACVSCSSRSYTIHFIALAQKEIRDIDISYGSSNFRIPSLSMTNSHSISDITTPIPEEVPIKWKSPDGEPCEVRLSLAAALDSQRLNAGDEFIAMFGEDGKSVEWILRIRVDRDGSEIAEITLDKKTAEPHGQRSHDTSGDTP
ncbi:MAG TPA: hypothetical protein DCZ95_16930 [Verrucomicrobia bacterium]|nr:MAG: hypothetical protein A2X46_09420 [Lentisphaerae bacterium GWF2_57_35]HBA85769.1 hypothetical protein [Verrucomicrobiota bacterium]